MIREFKVSVICYFLQEGVIGPKLNLLPVGTVGYSLSGLYLLTNPARLNLPGTKVPAGIALKVTEPHKLHHHVKVITHGDDISWRKEAQKKTLNREWSYGSYKVLSSLLLIVTTTR